MLTSEREIVIHSPDTMAKRMALIPEDLISSQHLQKPEFRIEDDMVELLDRGNLHDDMKVKLLGQLIMR